MTAAPRASRIRLLVLDVDGVLTDGGLLYGASGEETKRFHVHDGLALVAARKAGLQVAVLSSRASAAVTRRMTELGVTEIIQGCRDKGAALADLARRSGVPAERVAYIGDDWPDLSIMRRVGYPIAVGDADPIARAAAAYVTAAPGGRGAVREAIEHLLAAKGLREKALGLYGG